MLRPRTLRILREALNVTLLEISQAMGMTREDYATLELANFANREFLDLALLSLERLVAHKAS